MGALAGYVFSYVVFVMELLYLLLILWETLG
jgi:hypothetical protein